MNHDAALQAPAVDDQTAEFADTGVRRPRTRLLALTAVILIAVALGLAFRLHRNHPHSLALAPDSVGFIDAKSGRVTRTFPVGRSPSSVTVANDSVWVANYRDETVTSIDRRSGHSVAIAVGGHPTGIAAYRGTIWVWTFEGELVPIDPRYDSQGHSVSLAAEALEARSTGGLSTAGRTGGGITAGGGFLWIAAPPTTVIRVTANDARHRVPIIPDAGVEGAIVYRDGTVWVAGADQVVPIAATSGIPGPAATVGVVRDIAFGAGSLWVVSGGQGHAGVAQALRRVDPHTRLIQATISVGSDPVAVAAAAGSIWVANRTDGTIDRVRVADDRLVATTPVTGKPTALAADTDGVWVVTR